MPDRLKGITVEINGDTAGLSKALNEVNAESRSIQGELSEVQRLLKFNPENAELLAQRQQLLNRQIENTSNKLNQLRQVEHQVQAQFERGELGEEQFRAFQREIIATEGRLRHFEREAENTSDNAKKSFKGMGAGIANGIAGAVAGAGIGEVINKSLETASLNTKIKMSFDVPEEALGDIRNIITGIQAYGVEGEEALEGVRKQFALNGDLTVKENQKIVETAALISKTYGDIDFNELIQESNEFGEAIGISQQQALEMTNALLKAGFPPDQLDIMSEYGAQLHRAGYNAQEIQGIFAAGVETKSWNIDVLLDGVKEGRIRLAEFGQGVDKTTAGLIKGTDISAKKLQGWGTAITEGGDAGKIAFGEVATELGKIDDKNKRNAIGTRLFGTLWEEQGSKITDALAGANTKAGDYKKNQDGINKALAEQKNDPQYKLNKALQDMNTALAPLLTMVAEFVGKVANWVSQNPVLAAGITAAAVAIGLIMAAVVAILPVIALLTAENAALALSMAAATLPILAIIAAIAAAIAIGVLLYKNWGTIKKKARDDFSELWGIIKGAMNRIKEKWNEGIQDIKDGWGKVTKFFKGIDLKKIGSNIIQGLITGISNKGKNLLEKARTLASSVAEKMKKALQIGSPSKVTMKLGASTGEGFIVGLENTIGELKGMSGKFSNSLQKSLKVLTKKNVAALGYYFKDIAEDGDWLNDDLLGIPEQMQGLVMAIGKTLAPTLQGTRGKTTAPAAATPTKNITININSPQPLDAREANRLFNQTLSKMSLKW